jgi:uncharacterized repeat protein (TIGR03803 family)
MFAVLALCAATAMAVMGGTFTTLYSFCKGGSEACSDGQYPYAALIQGPNGSFYGTTPSGGTSLGGTIFKITPHGVLTTLHAFSGPDGVGPDAGLIFATNGYFYGTTPGGGNGYGTVFRMSPAGTLTAVHLFCVPGTCPDGHDSYAGVTQARSGLLYGVTNSGGAGPYGTLYKMTPTGTMTTLDDLGSTYGGVAYAAPVQASDGNLYGTTFAYGANGYGTLYKMTPSGSLTVLYNFCAQWACADGENPWGGLIQGADGDLYGTTEYGGALGSYGTVFRITLAGALQTLHSFSDADGFRPYGSLVQGTDGNFYGTTYMGGANGYGTVFQITPSGVLTTIHSFGGTDGQYPMAGLVQGTNGIFYGTTEVGGAYGYGTVFSLSMGLKPFIATVPVAAKVGAAVKILGNNLTGATSVSFNGTAAVYTVASTLITTTVPAGATTGTVQVVTPHGTLTSNAVFTVLP